ncbi:MAG TPA: phage holin family protein [Candidatus Nitrosotenuis sp.]|nr:phage holin family protein [Candidatus Nitrosotenuis sp.]
MKRQFAYFVLRWILNSVALWIAIRLLSNSDFADSTEGTGAFLIAGLVLSLVNTLLKPIVIILSLPAILLTLGLFMLIVNGLMVYIALALVPNFEITFIGAILAGMIVSLTNYLISGILELNKRPKEA